MARGGKSSRLVPAEPGATCSVRDGPTSTKPMLLILGASDGLLTVATLSSVDSGVTGAASARDCSARTDSRQAARRLRSASSG